MKITFFSAMAAIIALAGCNLSNGSTNTPGASFIVVQASPDAPSVDVYLNGSILQSNLAYTNFTYYATIAPGTYNFALAAAGTQSEIFDTSLGLQQNTAYSVFIIDSLSKIKAALVNDDLTAPNTDSAKVRFLDFCPNDTAVAVALTTGTVLFPNRSFNDQNTTPAYAVFQTVPAGTYNFQLLSPGTSNIKLAPPAITFTGGHIYTIFLKGFVGGTGAQAYSLGSIQNL